MEASSVSVCLILLLAVGDKVSCKIKFSDLTSICSKTDPNLGECIKNSANKLIPILAKKGIREYGMVPTDPLPVPFMSLDQSDNAVGLKLNITNSTHLGLGGINVEQVKTDIPKKHLELFFRVPRYSLLGLYDAGGRILLLPITGHGKCNMTTDNLKVKLVIDYKEEVRKGQMYCALSNLHIKTKFSKSTYFTLSGLFGGNKELSEAMSAFLNNNAYEVTNEMRPTLERTWSDLFYGLINLIFEGAPCDELFLP